MVISDRLARGILYALFLITLPSLSQAEDIPASQYCSGTLGDDPSQAALDTMADCESYVNSQTYGLFFTHANTWGETVYRGYYCRVDLYPEITGIYRSENQALCSTGPNECPHEEGTTRELIGNSPLGSSTCYESCIFNVMSQPGVPWIEANGTRVYFYDGVSTGEYCDESATEGAEPPEDFNSYLDDDGCYVGIGGRYCEAGEGECPSYVIAPDGKRYCQMPDDAAPCNESGGPSGEDYCGQDDPYYEDPVDSDFDGLPDGQDPDPNNPDTDGDGIPDGEDDDPDGDGEPGYSGGDPDGGDDPEAGKLEDGECKADNRIEPTCENFDPVNCAILLETWNSRCDEKLRAEEFEGTEDYREGDSLLDGDENEDNTIKSTEIDFGQFLSGLDESGAGYGGAMSCPPDRSISLGIGTIAIPFTFICEWAERIRPIIIMLGWLSAGFIAFRSMSGKEE